MSGQLDGYIERERERERSDNECPLSSRSPASCVHPQSRFSCENHICVIKRMISGLFIADRSMDRSIDRSIGAWMSGRMDGYIEREREREIR